MKRKKEEGAKAKGAALMRASISFPPDLYKKLGEIAKQKKVSLAWVVRDAVERYVADETEGEYGQRQTARSTGELARRAT
jgi:metal-responsive CopG/Arc/MetJ family transcriptional regulator